MTKYEPGLTLNARPRPRIAVLVSRDDVRSAWIQHLSGLFETVEGFKHLDEANWSEFDAVVTDRGTIAFNMRSVTDDRIGPGSYEFKWSQRFASHLDVFVRYGKTTGNLPDTFLAAWPEDSDWSPGGPDHYIFAKNEVVGRHVTRVNGLDPRLSSAIDRSLAKAAKERTEHLVFELMSPADADTDTTLVRPLLLGPDNKPVALSYERSSGASVWIIPEDAHGALDIFRVAYTEWSARDKHRYPPLPNWDRDRAFMSAAELTVLDGIAALEADFQTAEAAYLQAREALEVSLTEARKSSGDPLRALLIGAGAELEFAVADALRSLGFDVEDMDPENASSKREDLRVRDPDAVDWVAICEVKGYSGGAGVDAIRQVDHHAALFAAEHGRVPTKWIVVNAQRKQSPITRESPYVTRRDDVEHMEETGGLVIDTRALFEAVRTIEQNPELASMAREGLRTASGVVVDGSALISEDEV